MSEEGGFLRDNLETMNSGNVWDGGKAAMVRQLSSIYSLTFDEFQSTLGVGAKEYGSMNMDELLRNICTADDSHVPTATAVETVAGGEVTGEASDLQRQGSFTLSRTLSQKTVDEVWRGLVMEGGIDAGCGTAAASGFGVGPSAERQPTLGEITLEEFLVRAGVVREGVEQATTNGVSSAIATATVASGNHLGSVFHSGCGVQHFPINPAEIDLGFPPSGRSNGHTMANSMAFPQQMRPGGIVGIQDQGFRNVLMQSMGGLPPPAVMVPMAAGSPANQIASDGHGKSNGEYSSVSPVRCVFSEGFRGRKNSVVEKVVERRQRRMIKNRESAARSRARKQAYTMELEAEVAKLKEQNQELRNKQVELVEINKCQVLELLNQQHGIKRRCLRRTSTGP